MKKFTLLILVMLLGITGVNAESRTTTLWKGTDTGDDIKVAMSKLVKGATLNLTFNWLGSEGAQFSCFWWNSSSSEWVKIKNWQWVNNGESYSFTLTDDEFNAITNDKLCFKTEVPEKMKFAKITQTETLEPTSVSELWEGNVSLGEWSNFENLRYNGKGDLANAKMGDIIRITFTNTTVGCQLYVCDAASYVEFPEGYFEPSVSDENQTIIFNIDDATILESIQQKGIVLKGKWTTLTKVELLTFDDSFDAVPLTIGSDGIATFGSTKNLDFSGISEVTPYYVSEVNTGSVTLTSVEKTRAWAGYIVQGTPGTYAVPVNATEPDWIDAFNNLIYTGDYDGTWVYRSAYSDYSDGGDRETKIKTYYRYIFAKESDEIGFYKLATDYQRVTTEKEGDNEIGTTVYYHVMGAHKAYLETATDITPSSGSNPARVALRFSDITDIQDIRAIEKKSEDNAFYNLSGQRIAKPTKGIYIQNGKKYVVK